jgi:ABC-2 type transport system permease protein
MSLGVFASSVTRSQLIAAMVSLAAGITLFLLSFLSSAKTGLEAQLIAHLSLMEHMGDFAQGIVDTRPVILYLSTTVFFLFLSWKTVESRRWK